MKNNDRIQTIKKTHPFKLWDLCVYVVVAAAVIMLLAAVSRPQGGRVRVTYYDLQGKQITRFLPLDKDDVFEPQLLGSGHYKIVVQGGKVWTEESDCRDKVCMGMGKISRAGQQIICLPHKIVITIVGESGSDAEIA